MRSLKEVKEGILEYCQMVSLWAKGKSEELVYGRVEQEETS